MRTANVVLALKSFKISYRGGHIKDNRKEISVIRICTPHP